MSHFMMPPQFGPSVFDNVEDAEDYRPGGFHPVAINDLFAEGRYRVVHKLGFGGSSTIWLAREQHGGLVAIKVMRSDSSSSIKEIPDLSIPQFLSSLDPRARIQIPQDHFFEHGVNGSHLCLVYQLAGPSILSMSFCPGRYEGSRRLRKDLAKKVAKQLACTVELMHNSGFVHGDITATNVLFRVAEDVAHWTDEELYLNLGEPQTDPVLNWDFSLPGPHTPAELTAPIDNERITNSTFLQEDILLIDFGKSFPYLNPPPDYMPGTMPEYTPPEMHFEGMIGTPADVWGLACTIFQIYAGFPLFSSFLKRDILKRIVETLGKLPDPWWGAFKERPKWFDEDGNPKATGTAKKTSIKQKLAMIGCQSAPPSHHRSRSGIIDGPMTERGTRLDDDEIEVLGDLLEKMLQYRPQDRIKMCEVVAHPWFDHK